MTVVSALIDEDLTNHLTYLHHGDLMESPNLQFIMDQKDIMLQNETLKISTRVTVIVHSSDRRESQHCDMNNLQGILHSISFQNLLTKGEFIFI